MTRALAFTIAVSVAATMGCRTSMNDRRLDAVADASADRFDDLSDPDVVSPPTDVRRMDADTVDTADADASDTADPRDTADVRGTADASDTAAPYDTADGCRARAAEIAKQLQSAVSTTAVIRFDHESLALRGYAFVSGDYRTIDEATARARATADVPLPNGFTIGDGILLSGPNPKDEWVFFKPPSDLGSTVAISARNGLPVFAGTIVLLGAGDIVYPSTWSTDDPGGGCPVHLDLATRGFDLQAGRTFRPPAALMQTVLQSAILAALEQVASVLDAVVLIYASSADARDAGITEYVVLINAVAFE